MSQIITTTISPTLRHHPPAAEPPQIHHSNVAGIRSCHLIVKRTPLLDSSGRRERNPADFIFIRHPSCCRRRFLCEENPPPSLPATVAPPPLPVISDQATTAIGCASLWRAEPEQTRRHSSPDHRRRTLLPHETLAATLLFPRRSTVDLRVQTCSAASPVLFRRTL